MIFIITANHVKRNISKFGFTSYDQSVVEVFNKALQTFIEKKVHAAVKKAKGELRIEAHHVGGRVTMPSEYYGVESNHYVNVLNNNGVDMTVNNMWIRPPMDLMAPTVASPNAATSGGAQQKQHDQQCFSFALSAFKNACTEAVQKVSRDSTLSLQAQKELHAKFTQLLGSVLKSVARKSKKPHLSTRDVQEVLSMQKYKAFHKN
jgi:hypothetical protein